MKYSAIVLAAGKGSRTNLEYNKVFYRFSDGEVLLNKTIQVFAKDTDCTQIVLVTTPEEMEIVQELIDCDKVCFAFGGKTRQESVYNGLEKVKEKYVMIHDGARCFIEKESIELLKQTLESEDACLLMVPVIDTIKRVVDGYVVSTPLRAELYAAQTPQCFKTELIKDCHEQGKDGVGVSDDASLIELYSDVKVKVVTGSYANKKVTTKEDLY